MPNRGYSKNLKKSLFVQFLNRLSRFCSWFNHNLAPTYYYTPKSKHPLPPMKLAWFWTRYKRGRRRWKSLIIMALISQCLTDDFSRHFCLFLNTYHLSPFGLFCTTMDYLAYVGSLEGLCHNGEVLGTLSGPSSTFPLKSCLKLVA